MPGHGPEQSGRSFRSTSACWEVGWSGRIRPFTDVTDSWLLKVSSLHLSCSSLCCPHRVPLHAHAHTYSWHPSAKQAARARPNSARRLQLADVAVSCAHRQQDVRQDRPHRARPSAERAGRRPTSWTSSAASFSTAEEALQGLTSEIESLICVHQLRASVGFWSESSGTIA